MRILWFSNSPCGSLRRRNQKVYGGSWLITLEDELKKDPEFDLSVAYFSSFEEYDFEYEGVHYYPIFSHNNKNGFARVIQRYKSIEETDRLVLPILLDIVYKVKPDLIHIHGTEEGFGQIQDYLQDIPIVFSLQGIVAPCAEKYYSGIPSDFANKHSSLSKRIRRISFSDIYHSFKIRGKREEQFLTKAQHVIGRTQFDHTIPLLYNPNVKVYHCDEILRSVFYNATWEKASFGDTFRIVSVISSGLYKGYETILHASQLLVEHASFHFEWSIIGYQDDNDCVVLSEKYKGFASKSVNIKLLGRLSASEMVEIMLGSDLYVQASHIENSPNSLCEAMMLGMPIIATFAGGTSSMISDGQEGILIQDGDPFMLAGTIVRLKKDFEYAVSLGRNARLRAIKRHDPGVVCDCIKGIYKRIALSSI